MHRLAEKTCVERSVAMQMQEVCHVEQMPYAFRGAGG